MSEETESGLWDRMVWFIIKAPKERSLVKRVQCAGPRTSACGLPGVSEQPLFPSYPTTLWACRGSRGVVHVISGPLSCKGAFLSWQDHKQYLVQQPAVYTEFHRNAQGLLGEKRERVPGTHLTIQRNSAFSVTDGECIWKQNLPLKVLLLKKFNHNLKNAAHDLAECNLLSSKRWSTHANSGERYIFHIQ